MTDAERVLEIAARFMAGELGNQEGTGTYKQYAHGAVNGAEHLLKEWRTRYPDSTRTAPPAPPESQDVSDDLLERAAKVAEWASYSALANEIRDIQRARAAQREGW